jgi:hypothetical protein
MKRKNFVITSFVLAAVLALGVGCSKKNDDAQVISQIQARFSQDSTLSAKALSVEADAGVVTLSGTVDNDGQRDAAGKQAASVAGVKTVINNLQVATAAAAPAPQPDTTQPAAQPTPPPTEMASAPVPAPVDKPVASPPKKSSKAGKNHSGNSQSSSGDSGGNMSSGANQPTNTAAATPPPADVQPPAPAPPPPPKKFIIDQGTQLTVRLIDPIDSEKNQAGDTFHATLNAPLTSDGEEAVPSGVEVTGHLVDVKSASKFAGQSVVVLQLDSLKSSGRTYNLQTDQYKKAGSSRGKNTAAKVGGGAVVGSIIGALAGGGKGAAIGAAAGAGVGGGVQAASKSQQIKLASETVLNFTLQAPVTVVQAASSDANRQKLGDSQ